MDSYSVRFKSSVEKDLRRLGRATLRRVLRQIEALASDRFPRGAAKLSGAERLYRVRVGNYRIIYEVDSSEATITIHYVRHRRDAYRDL